MALDPATVKAIVTVAQKVLTDKKFSLHIDSREERWYTYYSHENDEYEEIREDDGGYCFSFLK